MADYNFNDGVGLDLIAKERQRQISVEGFGPNHDDMHNDGSLAVATACYAVHGMQDGEDDGIFVQRLDGGLVEDAWPPDFEGSFDKRNKHDIIKRLSIAGALCAAEIDRLKRLRE